MAARLAPIPTRGSASNSGGMVRPAWAVAVREAAVREAGCNPTIGTLRAAVNAGAARLCARRPSTGRPHVATLPSGTCHLLPLLEAGRLHGEGKGPAEIAEALGVSRISVWRALKAGAA